MTAYILNLIDLFCTMIAMTKGAKELNPFMQSVPVMVVYKTIIVGSLMRWLSHRPEKTARIGIRLCTMLYVVIDVYHIVGLILIGRGI